MGLQKRWVERARPRPPHARISVRDEHAQRLSREAASRWREVKKASHIGAELADRSTADGLRRGNFHHRETAFDWTRNMPSTKRAGDASGETPNSAKTIRPDDNGDFSGPSKKKAAGSTRTGQARDRCKVC